MVELALAGEWTLYSGLSGIPEAAAAQIDLGEGQSLRICTNGVTHWDSTLPAFLLALAEYCRGQGWTLDAGRLPSGLRTVLKMADELSPPASSRAPRLAPLFRRVGQRTLQYSAKAGETVSLLGEVVIAIGQLLRGKATYYRADAWAVLQTCGADALPIVGLVNLLVGAIIAFVGSVQLQLFGAGELLADGVAIATVREMAAVISAVVLSGRTGAAFAAQIATMQGNEEIDALRVMGVPVVEFLVMPRVLALVADGAAALSVCLRAGHSRRLPGRHRHARPVADVLPGAHRQCAQLASLHHRHFEKLCVRRPGGTGRLLLRPARRTQCGGGGRGHHLRRGRRHCRRDRGRCHLRGVRQCHRHLKMSLNPAAEVMCQVENLRMSFDRRLIQAQYKLSRYGAARSSPSWVEAAAARAPCCAMIGLLQPTLGNIRYGGQDYWSSSPEQQDAVRRRFGVLFQGSALFSAMTLYENVALPLQLYTEANTVETRALVRYKLGLVGLRGYEEYYPPRSAAACASAPAWRARWRWTRNCCSWTSPRPALDPMKSARVSTT